MIIFLIYLLPGYIFTMKLASNDIGFREEMFWNDFLMFHLHVLGWLPLMIFRYIDAVHRDEQHRVSKRKQSFK
ncbi:MAG: hypothetical protein UT24_C0015G0006 [Candidatus Woesebacteria bacterium GW2011_GWB1_39_12]|uniref:Uncharacterized protein n=1 Tax=Candidatus Woesebacteria bacterium GW2011_GWB1_39_12 TaxID=1618574 RepID=A0A0G0MAJ1_9BACT|nr:MAG: hypothetical protein UT24_C0015G0006 [Candidatus Woesebacteria bacterium GW2011_GWB1_39_12]